MPHLERLKHRALDQSPDVRSADPFRHPRGQQDRHARVLVFGTRDELRRRANRVFNKLRKGRVLASQFIIFRQLVRQPRDVGQQMSYRHVVAMVADKLRKEFPYRIVQFELASLEQGHQGRHADRLGDRAQEKHRLCAGRFSERSREEALPLNHVQHGGGNLAIACRPRQDFHCFVHLLAP